MLSELGNPVVPAVVGFIGAGFAAISLGYQDSYTIALYVVLGLSLATLIVGLYQMYPTEVPDYVE